MTDTTTPLPPTRRSARTTRGRPSHVVAGGLICDSIASLDEAGR